MAAWPRPARLGTPGAPGAGVKMLVGLQFWPGWTWWRSRSLLIAAPKTNVVPQPAVLERSTARRTRREVSIWEGLWGKSCEGRVQKLHGWSFWARTGRWSSQGCLSTSLPQSESLSQQTTTPAVVFPPAGTWGVCYQEPLPQGRKSQNW